MNSAMTSRLVLSMCLLSLTGVRAASGAEPAADGQEQARLLLGGKNQAAGRAQSRGEALSATAPTAAASAASAVERATDAQEQARLLLAGKKFSGQPAKVSRRDAVRGGGAAGRLHSAGV